jgi:hypothetical protein
MPLRDHFRAPLRESHHWESFHSAWANTIVRYLNGTRLPARYRAAPHVRLGSQVEIDVATFEQEPAAGSEQSQGNGVATAVWAPPRPTQTFATDLPAQDVFEVRVHDDHRGTRLVAAVELVSPANKDRPDHRHDFVVKCASYLQQQVAVVVVDIVTERQANLHAELMQMLNLTAPTPWPGSVPLHAVAYRTTKPDDCWRLDVWLEFLTVGAPLPALPLWLASDLAVPLELEPTYEETCGVLRIA